MTVDLPALTVDMQKAIDDASEDHLYVNDPPSGLQPRQFCGLGAILDGDHDQNERRVSALKRGFLQAARIWRANGGIGRAVLTLRYEHDSMEMAGYLDVWTSIRDEHPRPAPIAYGATS